MVVKGGRALPPLHLNGLSLAWGMLVLSAGFWLPAYRTVTEKACQPGRESECGVIRESWSTMVAVEGMGVLYVLAIPAVASVLVAVLVLGPFRTAVFSRWLGWCVVATLWAVSVLSSASVGWYFAPSALLLTVAVSRMQATRSLDGLSQQTRSGY
jgi:hypothetical protein